jgi:hypothetical protein
MMAEMSGDDDANPEPIMRPVRGRLLAAWSFCDSLNLFNGLGCSSWHGDGSVKKRCGLGLAPAGDHPWMNWQH